MDNVQNAINPHTVCRQKISKVQQIRDIWWPPLSRKHTISDIIATGTLSGSTGGKTNLNKGANSGTLSCSEINFDFKSDTSGPSIVSCFSEFILALG